FCRLAARNRRKPRSAPSTPPRDYRYTVSPPCCGFSQPGARDLQLESGLVQPYLSTGAAAEPAASQGLRVTELVASSWKLNFELSLGESAEYCLKRSGTSD